MEQLPQKILYGAHAVQLGWLSPQQFCEVLLQSKQIEKSLGELLVSRKLINEEQKSELDRVSTGGIGSGVEDSLSFTTVSPPKDRSNPDSTISTEQAGTYSFEVFPRTARFVTLRPLSRGGLGKVSVAKDVELEREVALKEILKEAVCDGQVERFLAEAKITGSLEHPGIVPVYGLETDAAGKPRYAMRLIRGESLQAKLEQFDRTTPQLLRSSHEAFRVLIRSVIDACYAVAYAHSRGVIHRDLKPSNIMLGKFGETLVVDWGMAKVIEVASDRHQQSELPMSDSRRDESDRTVMGSVLGTPSYMSPEQADGRLDLVSTCSDTFSLGATLYAVLTGQSPYKADTSEEALRKARACDWIHPTKINANVPMSLASIAAKAMSKHPADRYASPLELASDLDRWIAGEPVTALAEPFSHRMFRTARRHQTAVVALSGMLLVGLAASLAANYFISNERNVARKERDKSNLMRREAEMQRSNAEQERETADKLRTIATTAAKHAQDNSDTALAVIQEFVKNLADSKWSELPNFEPDRLAMIQLASTRCIQMLKNDPDNERLKLSAIQLLIRCSKLYRIMGKSEDASRDINVALSLVRESESLVDEDSKMGVLSDALFYVADDCSANRGEQEALEHCEHNLEIATRREDKNPDSSMAKLAIARVYLQHAGLSLDMGRSTISLNDAQQAAKRFDVLVNLLKQPPIFALHSNCYVSISKAYRHSRELAKAEEAAERAVLLGKAAKERFVNDNNITDYLQKARLELAAVRLALGDTQFARTIYDESMDVYEQLEREHKSVISYTRMQAEVLIARAKMELQSGNSAGAETDAAAALKLLARIQGEKTVLVSHLPFWIESEAILAKTTANQALSDKVTEDLKKHLTDLRAISPANPILSEFTPNK